MKIYQSAEIIGTPTADNDATTKLFVETLVSTALAGIPSLRMVVSVESASTLWTINHGLNSENVIVQAFDSSKAVIIPDAIQIVDEDNVTLSFSSAQAGTARIIFLD